MNREDIIRMAIEAGGCTPEWDDFWELHEDALVRFHAIAVAAEREACAKLCDELRDEDGFEPYGTECAAAIRARSEV